ncbi:hypothetical protein [Pseudomonas sp. OV226]|uniref:hypothetical protein n=1 Tax=Pseudomonas sp. OV226 TaxID=2135588 RepID=UPI000D6BD69B|nr:hypothetical protein [Pseudomonas sp. OV226]PWK33674.1 hypothetical protein C7534_118112 [Pseudomonas sp. OV226]
MAELAQHYDLQSGLRVERPIGGQRTAAFSEYSGPNVPPVELEVLHVKIGELAQENDYLGSELTKTGLLSDYQVTAEPVA